jgi:hypothetical protein
MHRSLTSRASTTTPSVSGVWGSFSPIFCNTLVSPCWHSHFCNHRSKRESRASPEPLDASRLHLTRRQISVPRDARKHSLLDSRFQANLAKQRRFAASPTANVSCSQSFASIPTIATQLNWLFSTRRGFKISKPSNLTARHQYPADSLNYSS